MGSGGSVSTKIPFKASLVGVFNQSAIGIQQPTISLPVYVSPFLDCGAWRTDALHISWDGLDSFVVVPVALIPQVQSTGAESS